MTIKDFALLVKNMRRLQKAYFASRKQSLLQESKDAERRVDAAIKEIEEDAKGPDLFAQMGPVDENDLPQVPES